MKVICDRGALVEALNLVGGVVVARTPKPVLQCVKLSTDEAGLTLTATDSEISIQLTTPRVEVQAQGECLLRADKLQSIVRESIDPTLQVETDQDQAVITGRDSTFKIFGQAVSDFPAIPAFNGEPDFTVTASELHRLVAMTLFATARENSRYAINGVLFERDGNKLSVVSTDGHRLALAKGSCKAFDDDAKPAIVPAKALNLLLRLFDDAEEIVRVKVQDGTILFATDSATLASNLVEGNFPPYRDVVPKDGDKKATIATDLLISGVRRAALLTNEESKGVRMAFASEGLTLTSRAPEMGEAQVDVELAEYVGDPVEIGFNPSYLLDALKVVDESQVTIELKANNKPGVVKTGNHFLYVVMPVNLQ